MEEHGTITQMMLRPLGRRRRLEKDYKLIINALERLDVRAVGESILSIFVKAISATGRAQKRDSWKDPAKAKRFIEFAVALYASGRISREEYVFFASFPIHQIQDDRWMKRLSDNDLRKLQTKMEAVRKKHRLGPDEYLPAGQGPKEYERLNARYDALYEKDLIECYRELGLNELADLKVCDPNHFEKLWERGRRSVFHKDEVVAVLKDLVIQYETDGRKAATARAYGAAITSLGAALEGLFVLRCLRSRKKALLVANSLARKLRPRSPEITAWSFETLIETCSKAGWLPAVSTSVARYDPAALAHTLRRMRNFIHPARRARERPWSEVDEGDYKYADSIYVILRLKMPGKLKKNGSI